MYCNKYSFLISIFHSKSLCMQCVAGTVAPEGSALGTQKLFKITSYKIVTVTHSKFIMLPHSDSEVIRMVQREFDIMVILLAKTARRLLQFSSVTHYRFNRIKTIRLLRGIHLGMTLFGSDLDWKINCLLHWQANSEGAIPISSGQELLLNNKGNKHKAP